MHTEMLKNQAATSGAGVPRSVGTGLLLFWHDYKVSNLMTVSASWASSGLFDTTLPVANPPVTKHMNAECPVADDVSLTMRSFRCWITRRFNGTQKDCECFWIGRLSSKNFV